MSGTPVRVRVRYPEVDRMNVVHHSHYFVWFEIGRTEVMRAIGLTYGELEQREGLFFPLVEAAARYRSPARYDEELDVHTKIARVDRLRVRFDYEIRRPQNGVLLADGHTVHVAVNGAGRPCRMPAEFVDRLEQWQQARPVPGRSS